MRKMATIRKIDGIRPILGADAIETAVVGGWTVVIKRGDFVAGDLAVYLEIDSWVPHVLAPFLSKGSEPREYNGIKGERLRTIKLKGQLSQGLLMSRLVVLDKVGDIFEGMDVSELLDIQKWEAPVPANLAGDVVGAFPQFIPKTDQERIQNLTEEFYVWRAKAVTWEVSEKIDGSSMTVFFKDGEFGVCSRNWQLKESESNTFWQVARQQNIEDILSKSGNIALQGELVGEGIQGNPYKLKGHDFFIFDVYDIDRQEYMLPTARRAYVYSRGLNHVPVMASSHVIDVTMDRLLIDAEGKSKLVFSSVATEREGLVFKSNDQSASFKAISNKFLVKNA